MVECFARALRTNDTPATDCPTCGNNKAFGTGIVVRRVVLGSLPAHWCGECGTMWSGGATNRPLAASPRQGPAK